MPRKKDPWMEYTYSAFRHSKDRAKSKGLPHTLTLKDIRELFPKQDKYECPYCKGEMVLATGEGRNSNGPSIDRIFPEKGYTKDNSIICCSECNIFKGTMAESVEPHKRISTLIRIGEIMWSKDAKSTIIGSDESSEET